MAALKAFDNAILSVDIMARKRRKGEVIKVDRGILLNILQRVEELERKLSEIEAKFTQKEP